MEAETGRAVGHLNDGILGASLAKAVKASIVQRARQCPISQHKPQIPLGTRSATSVTYLTLAKQSTYSVESRCGNQPEISAARKSGASVTVIAPTCAIADAWATALMVLGPEAGTTVARKVGIDALFLHRDERDRVSTLRVGHSF